MLLAFFNGFEIHLPMSGGKAGKGCNKTGSIQIRDGFRILKQFRFQVGKQPSYMKAIDKAKAFCQTRVKGRAE